MAERRAATERVIRRRAFVVRNVWRILDHQWAQPTGYLRKRNLNCGCFMCRVRYNRQETARNVVDGWIGDPEEMTTFDA